MTKGVEFIKQDFELIVHKFPESMKSLKIFPLGDLHIGSQQFDLETWITWVKLVRENDGYVVIVGDLLDNGLKNSKTNAYEATMRPREQKEWLKRELAVIRDRIIGACRGNHEYRAVEVADECPMYDVMAKLDLEDLYRENMAFLKLNLGFKSKERQFSYTMALAHGKSRNKTEIFGYAVDGLDVMVTGHTHQPSSTFPSKIVIDSKNEQIRMVDFTHIVVPSFQSYGGYALRDMYMPQSSKIPMIELNGTKKGIMVKWV